MMGKGLVISEPVHKLVAHKDYAVEMVTSIIKEMDLDRCGEHSLEDLGASGLFDLSKGRFRRLWYLVYFLHSCSNC